MVCSKCGAIDHNIRTCPHAAAAASNSAEGSSRSARLDARVEKRVSTSKTSAAAGSSAQGKRPAASTGYDAAQCAVCLQAPMKPPIFATCPTGHAVCSNCHSVLLLQEPPRRCPECRAHMLENNRLIALERVLSQQHRGVISCFNGCMYCLLSHDAHALALTL